MWVWGGGGGGGGDATTLKLTVSHSLAIKLPCLLCFYSDEDEATTILINAGADVNSKNTKGATPLIIAAVKGHYSVLRKLADHTHIKLHDQVSGGATFSMLH